MNLSFVHPSWSVRHHGALRSAAPRGLLAAALLVPALCGGLLQAARADDRPFLRTGTAIVEDDDERVFETSLTHVSGKKERSTQWQLGYSFSPTLSLELELGSARDKVNEISAREQGLGLRVAWIDPARQGWGMATKFSAERERESGEEQWNKPLYKAVMAFSLPLAEKTAWLHANVGMQYQNKESTERRWTSLWSLGAQKEISRRFEVFAELAGNQERSDQIAHAGVRHWFKRQKVALDLGLGRQLAPERRDNFVSLNLSVYDISF